MTLLRWVYRHWGWLLTGLAVLTVLYGVLLLAAPSWFNHPAGYVVASIALLTIFVIDLAAWKEHRR